jgi:thioredoxin reductase
MQLCLWIAALVAACSGMQTCIVGGGPGGLQVASLLRAASQPVVLFERASNVGAFFAHYPVGRELISINKRATGRDDSEFALRHDWNSLLGGPLFQSNRYWPHADELVTYLREFANATGLLDGIVKTNHEVVSVRQVGGGGGASHAFELTVRHHTDDGELSVSVVSCKRVVWATGFHHRRPASFENKRNVDFYDTFDVNSQQSHNATILILGNGNAAFEIATAVYERAAAVHVVGRRPLRFAWATHYVGDLRHQVMGLLDAYQLKSLGGIAEIVDAGRLMFLQSNCTGKTYPLPKDYFSTIERADRDCFQRLGFNRDADLFSFVSKTSPLSLELMSYGLRSGYDRIVSCLGFTSNKTAFSSMEPSPWADETGRFPIIGSFFESARVPNLFFAGVLAHGNDYRRSSGGFVHGIRYNARILARFLLLQDAGTEWTHTLLESSTCTPGGSCSGTATLIAEHMLRRLNSASAIYHLFGQVCDFVVVTSSSSAKAIYIEEVPCSVNAPLALVPSFAALGEQARVVFTVTFEYGETKDWDPFGANRVKGDFAHPERSLFLHPVLRAFVDANRTLIHTQHLAEDFLTRFDSSAHRDMTAAFVRQALGER